MGSQERNQDLWIESEPLDIELSAAKPVRHFTPETRPGWRDLWAYRSLIKNLALRNIKVKYQRSFLGFLWTLINPLVTVLVLITVFSLIIRLGIEDYWAFLLSGYFVWNLTQQCLYNATYVMQEHASFNRNVSLPSEVPILSAALAKLMEFAIEIGLVAVALVIFHLHRVPSSLLLLPLAVLVLFVMVVGLMFPIATISVLFRDVQHALPLAITTLFYVSPVFYPVTLVPETYRSLYFLNPLAGILEIFHLILYRGEWPSWYHLGTTALVAAVIFIFGYTIFARYRFVCVEIA